MPEVLAPENSITGGAVKEIAPKGPRYNEDEVILDETEETEEVEETPITEAEGEEEETGEEIEEEIEEEAELKELPFNRPSVSDIKAKFPDLFKEFPALKESYFRELEFTKLFPTVEDAQEAFNDNEAFTTLSDAVLSGDPLPLLDSVEKTDSKALELFSMSFLPTLYKKNQDLYSQTVTPLFQNLVRSMYSGRDENTKNAALVLSEFLFGDVGEAVAKGEKSIAKSLNLTEEQSKAKNQKEEQLTTAFRASAGKVQTTITQSLESLVLKNTAYDPNKVFSPFLRKQGAQEVIKRILAALASDKGHMTVIGARWKRAKANGYTSDDESKIISTYLARAKSLIPKVASEVSAAMLGTKKKAAAERSEKVRTFPKENNSGRVSSSAGKNGSQKVDYNKMSDMDILSI